MPTHVEGLNKGDSSFVSTSISRGIGESFAQNRAKEFGIGYLYGINTRDLDETELVFVPDEMNRWVEEWGHKLFLGVE